MNVVAGSPGWWRPLWVPWVAVLPFLPDKLNGRFRVAHWALWVASVVGLSVLGWWVERGAARAAPGAASATGGRSGFVRWALIALVAWLAFGFVVTLLSFHGFNVRYLAANTAYFNQVFWNTVTSGGHHWLEGSILQETTYNPPVHSHFALHVSPFLLFLAPIYALVPRLGTLFLLRNVAIGLGAWLLYRELRRPLGALGAVIGAAAYVVHSNTVVLATGDWNEMAFAVPAVIWGVGAALRLQIWECALAALLAAAVREDAVLPVAAVAFVMALRTRSWSWGWLSVACAGWFALTYRLILPAFDPSGGQLLSTVYQGMGGGPLGVMGTLVTQPGRVLHSLASPAHLVYLAELARSYLGLPLFSWALWAAGPGALALLLIPLDQYSDVLEPWRHYSTLQIASLALAGGLGAGWWLARSKAAGPARTSLGLTLCWLLLSGSLYTEIQDQGLQWLTRARPSPLAPVYRELLGRIPPRAPVAAPFQMMPALSQRRAAYTLRFPMRPGDRDEEVILRRAAYLVVDRDTVRARSVHGTSRGYSHFLASLAADSLWKPVLERDRMVLYEHSDRAAPWRNGDGSRPARPAPPG